MKSRQWYIDAINHYLFMLSFEAKGGWRIIVEIDAPQEILNAVESKYPCVILKKGLSNE